MECYYRITKKEYEDLLLMKEINYEAYEKYLREFESLNIDWNEVNVGLHKE